MDMHIIESRLFKNSPEIVFGLSTKIGPYHNSQFHFNLSLTVGDDSELVHKNREAFYNELGFTTSQIAVQKQIHSDLICIVDKPGQVGECDGMITANRNIGLAISTADCVPIFIYDQVKKVIAGIHSGWRGTQKQILQKSLIMLKEKFFSDPRDLIVYIGPSISQKNYEVGNEVAEQFDHKYTNTINGKLCLDLVEANLDMIYGFGIPKKQVEVSQLCSYEEKELLHSYRRDGKTSGRSLGVIAIKGI